MRVITVFTLAWRSMWRNRLRALFMMLGIVAGISSMIVLSSVGRGAKQETMKRFRNMLGTFDTIMIRPGGGRSRGMPTLTNVEPTLKFDDARALATEIPGIDQVALMQSAFDIDVSSRDHSATPAVFGASPNLADLRGDEVTDGSFFSQNDMDSLARVAVLGSEARKALFPDEYPLGKTIRIANVPFQVKGVLRSRGAGPSGASLDNLIMIPVTTASKRLFNRDFLTMVVARVKDPSAADAAAQNVAALLRARHHLQAGALDDFTVTSPRAIMGEVTKVGSTLSKTLLGVAALAMGIGGAVIMSLMLIAVAERRSEIGLRRSVGATRTDILVQFLSEAIVVSSCGGLAGITIGVGGVGLVADMQKLVLSTQPLSLIFAAALSIGIGLLFGIYPAWKAARVDPVAALRA